MASTTLFEETLDAWAYVRASLIDELDNIPEASYSFRPTPDVRSPAEIGQHVLNFGLMMVGELTRPDGDFTRQSFEEHVREHGGRMDPIEGKAALIEALRATHIDGDRRFREVGELRMLQLIKQFSGTPATRISWLWHGIEHESYHTAQITVYARLIGLVPALTQKTQAAAG